MRDCQSDLRALRERGHCFDKAPQQVQVLCMCHKVLFGLQVGEIDAGHERMTGRAMAFGMNRGATSACRILFQPDSWAKQNQPRSMAVTDGALAVFRIAR
jgi:hypothetical protein